MSALHYLTREKGSPTSTGGQLASRASLAPPILRRTLVKIYRIDCFVERNREVALQLKHCHAGCSHDELERGPVTVTVRLLVVLR
jgi:hypothetical protein